MNKNSGAHAYCTCALLHPLKLPGSQVLRHVIENHTRHTHKRYTHTLYTLSLKYTLALSRSLSHAHSSHTPRPLQGCTHTHTHSAAVQYCLCSNASSHGEPPTHVEKSSVRGTKTEERPLHPRPLNLSALKEMILTKH